MIENVECYAGYRGEQEPVAFHLGVDAKVVPELVLKWNRGRCRPPLSDHEMARVVESIAHLHERGKADDPFEQ